MISGKRIYPLLLILVIASLFLASCERPIPGADGDDVSTGESGEENGGESDETDAGAETADEDAADETVTDDGAPTDSGGSTDEADSATDDTTDTDTTDSESGDAADAADSGDAAESGEDAADAGEDMAEDTDAAEDTETDTDTGETDATADEGGAAEDSTAVPAQHVVVAGDTLYKIGLQYGISWVAIAEENQLSTPYKIIVGQTLNLPQRTAPAEEPDDTTSTTETTYIVKAGDNLFRIGLAYGITWVQLAEANGLVNPNQITVGQTLKIPVDTPGPAPNFTHVVKPGETLYLISLQYGVSWTSIAEANQLTSPYVIFVGETLTIPGGE